MVNSQNANNVPQVVFNAAPGKTFLLRRTDLCVLVRNFQAGQSIRTRSKQCIPAAVVSASGDVLLLEQQFGGP